MPILRNWSTMSAQPSPYRAPEDQPPMKLSGEIYDHPNFKNGEEVITSAVKKSIGRIVETCSGTVYTLEGEPNPEWLKFLKKINYEFDIDNPISIREVSRE